MPQLTRWRIRLQDFDFKIEYLPGPQQVCADGLSRLGVDDKDLQISMGDFLPTNAAAISLINSPVPLRALNNYAHHIAGRAPTPAETIWNDEPERTHVDLPHLTDCSDTDDSDDDKDIANHHHSLSAFSASSRKRAADTTTSSRQRSRPHRPSPT